LMAHEFRDDAVRRGRRSLRKLAEDTATRLPEDGKCRL
jgi:hypothetical protein